MRNLAIFGAKGAPPFSGDTLEIDRLLVRSGIVTTRPRVVDWSDPDSAHKVLVRVHAFSCNYRDRSILVRMQDVPAARFFVIGSEFVGSVVAVGSHVTAVRPGDRVMAQNGFTGRGVDETGAPEGIPSNQASKEFQWLHERQLALVPDDMPDEVAAAFSVGAQTAYSMVRRLDPAPGARVLVTSATSNTSLHLVAALRQRKVRLVCTTTAAGFDSRIHDLGADEVIRIGRSAEDAPLQELRRRAEEIGGFDHVFDPFFDLHLETAIDVLAPFGKYTTCGLVGQSKRAAEWAGVRPMDAEQIMIGVMVKNLSIIGNCIGVREDLDRAIRDYSSGAMCSVVDSVFTGNDTVSFLDRSFNDRARFGKVVFCYT